MNSNPQTLRRSLLKTIGALPLLGSLSTTAHADNSPYSNTESDRVRIGNQHLEIVFREDNGGIEQFRSKQGEFTLRDTTEFDASSWKLYFYSQEHEYLETGSSEAGRPAIETNSNESEATVTLTWSNPALEGSSREVTDNFNATITLTVTVGAGDRTSRWQLQIDNRGERAVKRMICPYVTGVTALGEDGTDALYVPSRMGRKYSDPTTSNLDVHRYPSGFGTMQFVAYLADERGIYAAAEDTEGYAKRLEFVEIEDQPFMEYRPAHLVPYQPGEDISIPYPMTLGVHQGNWMTACDRYRNWVESEGWLENTEPRPAQWYSRQGVSYEINSYYRPGGDYDRSYPFDEVRSFVSSLADRLGIPFGTEWNGWHTYGYPGAGDWWPPKEGIAEYRQTVESLQTAEIEPSAWINPTRVYAGSDYWRGLSDPDRLPITVRDGEYRPYDFGIGYDEEFYQTSASQPQWQAHYSSAFDRVSEAGVRHFELDGFPWQWVPNCWNSDHDHPDGKGGKWHPTRMRQYLSSLHDKHGSDSTIAISGEGTADIYLPYLNILRTRDAEAERNDSLVRNGTVEPIPMFPYTFNEYVFTRTMGGHIGSFTSPDMQRLIAGRSIEWGTIPGFMGDYRPENPNHNEAVLTYYARIGNARSAYANRFLAGGEWLPRPELERTYVSIPGGHLLDNDDEIRTTEVKGRGWRSPEGDLGIVLTNVSNRRQTRNIEFDLSTQPYELPTDPLVYIVRNGDYRSVEGVIASVEIAPSDVVLIGAIENQQGAMTALSQIEQAQTADEVDNSLVSDAKSAFDAHDFQTARERAKRAVTSVEASSTASEEVGSSSTTGTTSEEVGTSSTTNDSGPGFGIASALGSIAGATALSRWLSDDEDE